MVLNKAEHLTQHYVKKRELKTEKPKGWTMVNKDFKKVKTEVL